MNKISSAFKKGYILVILSLFIFMLSGCASYKYIYGVKPYQQGYVVTRNDTLIPEYTTGKDDKAPSDLSLAKERFTRRRAKVEYYYKKMDILYTPLTSIASYPFYLLGTLAGIFKLPFIIISDYRYEHNAEYRNKIDGLEAEKRRKEKEERNKLQDELNAFIKQDLQLEEYEKRIDAIERELNTFIPQD